MANEKKEEKKSVEKDNDVKILEEIHLNIHALRMMPGYKPSLFEYKLSKIIAERFAPICKECAEKLEQYKSTPAPTQKKDGWMKRLNNALEDSEVK